MEKTESSSTVTENVRHSSTVPDNALKDQKSKKVAKRLETVVAVLLGVTTLLSAWASWIAHLHGGIQSINFTKSNNMASKATAESNFGMQAYLADYMVWNTLMDYNYDLERAKAAGDETEAKLIADKIESFKKQNGSEILAEGIKWMEENNNDSPFNMPGIAEKYFDGARETFDESQGRLEEGMRDNTKGDSYMLVTVIYSLTLFLLGIVNTFKNNPNRIAVMAIATAFLLFAVFYMLTIPMPTGFDKMNFFEFK